ncbi:MAG: hypothetical protein ACXABY_36420 [Candidatus Thorarchaeota archaeon]
MADKIELKRIGSTEKYDKYMMVENEIFRYVKSLYVRREYSAGAESLFLSVEKTKTATYG